MSVDSIPSVENTDQRGPLPLAPGSLPLDAEHFSSAPICCVYFLTNRADRAVYVGQTTDLGARLRQHRAEKRGLWSGVRYIRCEKATLKEVEAYWIRTLKPKLNGVTPKCAAGLDSAAIETLRSDGVIIHNGKIVLDIAQ